MEKQAVIRQDVTPTENAEHQEKVGMDRLTDSANNDLLVIEQLDENHPTRRAMKALEERLKD